MVSNQRERKVNPVWSKTRYSGFIGWTEHVWVGRLMRSKLCYITSQAVKMTL